MLHSRASWVLAALACAAFLCHTPQFVHADLIPAAPDQNVGGDAAGAPTATTGPGAPRDVVANHLAALGMDAGEIDVRLAQMQDADLATLAASPGQVQFAAGLDEQWWFILLAALIVVGMIVLTVMVSNKDGQGGVSVPGSGAADPPPIPVFEEGEEDVDL